MTQRGWTLHGADSEFTILVITGNPARLDALATEVAASSGYFTFVAIPELVGELAAVTQFDLVVVVSDVTPADRDLLAQLQPPIDAKVLALDAQQELTIGDHIRSRLER